eukprot:1624715-Rhodomonas_salina.1
MPEARSSVTAAPAHMENGNAFVESEDVSAAPMAVDGCRAGKMGAEISTWLRWRFCPTCHAGGVSDSEDFTTVGEGRADFAGCANRLSSSSKSMLSGSVPTMIAAVRTPTASSQQLLHAASEVFTPPRNQHDQLSKSMVQELHGRIHSLARPTTLGFKAPKLHVPSAR